MKIKMKLTDRDVIFFFLGVLTIILIDLVWYWDNNIKAFKKGYNDAIRTETAK